MSKSIARQEPYKQFVLELFRTADPIPFEYDNQTINYLYLVRFLQRRDGQVYPEFPTGNGKIDLIIHYAGQRYGLELKSFTDSFGYQKALRQAATYGQQLGLPEISVVFFVEAIDDPNRAKYETPYVDQATGVSVSPVFVATGR